MVEMVIEVVLFVVAVSSIVMAVRLLLGPTLGDRVVAFDGMAINAIILIVLAGMRLNTVVFFDVAIIIAILAFMVTAAIGKYMEKGRIIDGPRD